MSIPGMFSSNTSSDDHVFNACPCCNNMINTDFGKVIGCSCVQTCFCLKEECCFQVGEKSKGCLLGAPVVTELMLCKIGAPCCTIGLKQPKMEIEGHGKCFCFRSNIALPPNEDTPMMVSLYGLLCFPKQGCCVKFGDAK
jgi:hypothetical protein